MRSSVKPESLNLYSSFRLSSLKAKRNLPQITLRVQALRSLIFGIDNNWVLVSFICLGFFLPPCVLSRQETINAAEITANVHAGYLLGPSSTIFNSYCQDKNYCPVLSFASCKSRIHILHRLKFFFLLSKDHELSKACKDRDGDSSCHGAILSHCECVDFCCVANATNASLDVLHMCTLWSAAKI